MKYYGSALILLALLLALAPVRAADSATTPGVLASMDRALDAGMPHAVLATLRDLAERKPNGKAPPPAVVERYLRASLMAGKPTEALALAATVEPTTRIVFWMGQCSLETGDFPAAIESFESVLSDPAGLLREEALLGLARALAGLSRHEEALEALAQFPERSPLAVRAGMERAALLLQAGDPEGARSLLLGFPEVPPALQHHHALLLASAEIELGNSSAALRVLSGLQRNGTPEGVRAALLEASALADVGDSAAAAEVLENLLLLIEAPDLMESVFGKLRKLYVGRENPSFAGLRRVASDRGNPDRAAIATFHLASAMADSGNALQGLETISGFAEDFPDHPMIPEAHELKALLLWKEGRSGEALRLLGQFPETPSASFVQGLVLADTGATQRAVAAFEVAAADPGFLEPAIFNAALCLRMAGIPDDENPFFARLVEIAPSGPLLNSYRFSAALAAARDGHPDAEGLFQEILPAGGIAVAVPFAEWLLVANRTEEAGELLRRFPEPTGDDHQEFLQVLISDDDTPAGIERTRALAAAFLENHPESRHRRDVKLKLAEIAYREGDFLTASEKLSELAEEATDPGFAARTRFLAARAASKLMSEEALDQALALYEETAKTGGEMEHRARFEQALLLTAQQKPAEALVLYERIASSSSDPDLRAAAIIEKGDTHFASGPHDSNQFRKAIEAWAQLLENPESPYSPYWEAQALTKMGVAKDKLGEEEAALESFYRVLLSEPDRQAPGFWVDKAGFEAGRLLEEREAWQEAIRVYDLLAQRSGPRAEEAAARANRLRLQNFLWED